MSPHRAEPKAGPGRKGVTVAGGRMPVVTRERTRRRPLWRLVQARWLIQIGLVLLLVALALWRVDLNAVAQSFADANYGWLLVAFGIYVVARFVHAIEWRMT